MAQVPVLNWEKKKVGEVDLAASIFEQPLRKDLLQEVVVWQLACRRQGTHNTKTRAFVRGGGKKPFKQKGTGNARQGSTRSPLNPGGAKLFGPSPRDYSYTLPKKVKQLGLKTALSFLLKEGRLVVVEGMDSKGKTKELATRLKGFGMKSSILLGEANPTFSRAARNLKDFKFLTTTGLNVYDLLKYDGVILSKGVIKDIATRCGEEA